ncbi:MAG: antibiotic biosynthesis monooxygenase [Myxococcota bacterium]
MLSHGIVVRIVAKDGKQEEVAEFLKAALSLAQAEDFTPVWFALRHDQRTFFVFDAFANAGDRQKHIDGEIANRLLANADALLAEPPAIQLVDVLAQK